MMQENFIISAHNMDAQSDNPYTEVRFTGTEDQAAALCQLLEHLATQVGLTEYTCSYGRM